MCLHGARRARVVGHLRCVHRRYLAQPPCSRWCTSARATTCRYPCSATGRWGCSWRPRRQTPPTTCDSRRCSSSRTLPHPNTCRPTARSASSRSCRRRRFQARPRGNRSCTLAPPTSGRASNGAGRPRGRTPPPQSMPRAAHLGGNHGRLAHGRHGVADPHVERRQTRELEVLHRDAVHARGDGDHHLAVLAVGALTPPVDHQPSVDPEAHAVVGGGRHGPPGVRRHRDVSLGAEGEAVGGECRRRSPSRSSGGVRRRRRARSSTPRARPWGGCPRTSPPATGRRRSRPRACSPGGGTPGGEPGRPRRSTRPERGWGPGAGSPAPRHRTRRRGPPTRRAPARR